MRPFILGALLLSTVLSAPAQTFTGTNAPNTFTNFTLTLSADATNLALTLGGTGTAYSYLLVRKDSSPLDTIYDFSSRLDGATNALYLEQPEVAPGTYFVQVRTPASSSQSHAFTLVCETNRTDLRTALKPVTKVLAGPLSGGARGVVARNAWQYFRVELTTNTFWMAGLDVTNQTAPDLYVASAQIPTTSTYLKASVGLTNDLLAFTSSEGAPGVYYVGVFGATPLAGSSVAYTLRVQTMSLPTLLWDPGTTDAGTQVYTNLSGTGGDYYFRILTANPSLGAWRTVLQVLANDANLYLSRGVLPTPSAAGFKSEQPGSDGLVLALNSDFQPGEDWYILVRAKAGAQWTLVSGSPYVTDLGTVAADASTGSGAVAIGPEGIRFFSATAPPEMLAWRLWLNGLTNSILLKKTTVPLPRNGGSELSQPGQLLVVPPYLSAAQYLIGIPGTNGATINLDSRQQTIVDLAYGSSTNAVVTGFGYATYRVQVPAQQIAWQLTLPSANGNPFMAVRENLVPNENNNDAFSELGSPQTNNITLVPPPTPAQPGLSSGTFYITLYSTNQYQFTLQSGPATITDINYSGVVTNDDPGRVGWRLYRVQILSQQQTTLGWNLLLTNFAPGTRIALRRSSAPGIWSYRANTSVNRANYYDQIGIADFLQQPDHQADVWYIGVFNPTNALGAFTLITGELLAADLQEGAPSTQTNVLSGRWEFFKVQLLPSDAQGSNAVVGWDLRLTNVTSGLPRLVVRRDRLPVSLSTDLTTSGGTWPSGKQWAAGADWTKRTFSPDGSTNEDGRILALGVGRPLEPGTYYIGVLDNTGTNLGNYTLLSRWIGVGRSIPVQSLDWNAGAATNTLPPREAAYYQVVVPTNAPSWKVRLTPLTGEAMLVVTTNTVPAVDSEKRMQKPGAEQYARLPQPGTNCLAPGTNYLTVIGEGSNATNSSRIGAGANLFVLESLGPLPLTDLGTLTNTDLVVDGALAGGESAAYRFYADPSVLGFWITLENTTGNPWVVGRFGPALPDPGFSGDTYGNEGGETAGASSSSFLLEGAGSGLFVTVMVKARAISGVYADSTYTLRVKAILPTPLSFDGGSSVITDQPAAQDSVFVVDVPTNAAGWDLRLTNILSGNPHLTVARDTLPICLYPAGFSPTPFAATNWPSGACWPAASDWTLRDLAPDGSPDSARILAMGLGRPLQPGRYYAAVRGGSGDPVNCAILSRGIGAGLSILLTDLDFAGGQTNQPDLPAREAAYFRVTITNRVASWKVRLSSPDSESLLLVSKDTLPNVGASASFTITNSAGRKMQKIGDEQFLLLPDSGQSNLSTGAYYLAVVGEGQAVTNATQIGDGGGSFTLTSVGEAPTNYLGDINNTDILVTNSLSGGEVGLYQFNVPPGFQTVEARLENTTGNPVMVLGLGARIPDPSASGLGLPPDNYGAEGGESPVYGVSTNLITLVNPTNLLYNLIVKARANSTLGPDQILSNATYVLRLHGSVLWPLQFEDSATVVNQAPGTWRYFQVTVPADAQGWDLRLVNVSSGLPRLVVRRGLLPNSLTTPPWSSAGTYTNWPATNQWAPLVDGTGRNQSADGTVDETGRYLFMGMNHPLQPDVYFIGVANLVASTNMSYTLQSRGVGTNYMIPLLDLPLAGSVTNLGLPPREAAYYRVVIPSNTPNWKVQLKATAGECLLAGLRAALPNVDTMNDNGTLANGKRMKRPGDEYFIQLPAPGSNSIPAGTNYLAVLSEGINPASPTRIGSGNCAYVLTSLGAITPVDLGLVTPEDLVYPDTLGGGESQPYQFTVPDGTYAVKVSLENRVANPTVVALAGAHLPDPGAAVSGLSQDAYGNDGGYAPSDGHTTIVTLPNPVTGKYSLMVKARAVSGNYLDASYTLRVQEALAPALNFSNDLNTNGLSNTTSGLLQDNERAFFMILIPATNNGQPVIGWKLDVSQQSGLAWIRVRKDSLPSDANASAQTPFVTAEAIIAPPYLTNGVWFVEVKATGSTAFTLTSSPLTLARPSWAMPAPGQTNSTPGVTLPTFGDTGIDTNGVPVGGDSSIFLPQGRLDYYAVQIPGANLGLLRAELDAVSGNSVLYLRAGAVPTLSHSASGASGYLYDRSITAASSQSQRANWVPLDGKTETQLKPGLWYLAVGAPTNSNVRYRLAVSTGNVTDLPIQSNGLTNQTVLGGDWAYYRVPMPTALPLSFNVSFTQARGDAQLFLRDTVPAGNGISGNTWDIKDWATDAKNLAGPYLNYDAPGTYAFSTPPVRPGQVLYLGFLAKSDSTFSVSVTTNGAPAQDPAVVAFYGGTAATNVAGFSSALFRVDVPPEATRWIHTSIHATNLLVLIDQGTVPTRATARWTGSTTNSFLNMLLVTWNTTLRTNVPPAWPWVAGQSYFLLVTNLTAIAQDFILVMDGKNPATDDSDRDGLPDAWEMYYFGRLGINPSADADGDGVSNYDEYLDGTDPTDPKSYRARLYVTTDNGAVLCDPDLPSYPLGSTVNLTAVAASNYAFVCWSGANTSSANPLTLVMDTAKHISAIFELAGDNFSTALSLSGSSCTTNASNVNFTKEPGEPNHAGNPGGTSIWWRWTAPASGPVTFSTAGSTFDTLLAIYTGNSVSTLSLVGSDHNSTGGANRSKVTFTAVQNTTYDIAVDGYNGASGMVTLSLTLTTTAVPPPLITHPAVLANATFQFTLAGQASQTYSVEYSSDLATWLPLGTVTTAADGTVRVSDSPVPQTKVRFYRVRYP
ncbi:MAG: pre-peptidase C-terminal domain-containing protein [Verrucomicrobiota bacterium]|jgi:hypothetical protein